MKPMTTDELASWIAEIRHRCDLLENGVMVPTSWDDDGKETAWERSPTGYGMLNLARAATADGYPQRSLGQGGGSASVLDENGDPMPPVADPTGDLATALADGGGVTDSIRYHRASFERGIRGAAGDLALAVDALGKLVKLGETSPGEPGCRVHAKYFPKSIPAPIYRSRLCRFCYDFSLAEGADPPEAVLVARDRGQKLSQPMVAAALAEERKARRQSNKKRKATRR